MRIVDLLKKESILLNGSPKSKSEAIDMLVDLQVKGGNIADKEEYKKVMNFHHLVEILHCGDAIIAMLKVGYYPPPRQT